MIVLDANLLLYAYNPSTPQHDRARRWLEQTLSGSEMVGLPWTTVLAFLRIGTNARAYQNPLTVAEAVEIVSTWFAQPNVCVLDPGEGHWRMLATLLPATQAKGPLVTDAHLATQAMEHGALLCSTDGDFSRFPQLRWQNPLAG